MVAHIRARSWSAGELVFPSPRLEKLLQTGQERGRIGAVKSPVIKTLSNHTYHARRKERAFGRRHNRRLQLDRVGRENCNLRRVDDRGRESRSEGAIVADRVGAARKIVRTELAGLGFFDQAAHRLGQPGDGEILRVAHDRYDKTVVRKVDRDAKRHGGRQRQRLAVKARIDLRKGLNGEACRARYEGQIRQREPVRFLECSLVLAPDAIDCGEVDFNRLEDMRNRSPVFRQPFSRPEPHRV